MWNIFVNGVFYGTARSITRRGAIDQFYNKHGGASKYSGIAYNSITAEKFA